MQLPTRPDLPGPLSLPQPPCNIWREGEGGRYLHHSSQQKLASLAPKPYAPILATGVRVVARRARGCGIGAQGRTADPAAGHGR